LGHVHSLKDMAFHLNLSFSPKHCLNLVITRKVNNKGKNENFSVNKD